MLTCAPSATQSQGACPMEIQAQEHSAHSVIVTIDHQPRRNAMTRQMMADLAGERMQIALEPDASGWLSIAARCGGQEVFRAWLDRPYEVYEFWPEGAAILPLRTTEAPGRIGKRRNWVNLSAAAWPPLARFANSFGVVAASEMEEPLQERSGES